MGHHLAQPRSPAGMHSTTCIECQGILLKAYGPHPGSGWAHLLVNGMRMTTKEFSMTAYLDDTQYMSLTELRGALEEARSIIRTQIELHPEDFMP